MKINDTRTHLWSCTIAIDRHFCKNLFVFIAMIASASHDGGWIVDWIGEMIFLAHLSKCMKRYLSLSLVQYAQKRASTSNKFSNWI